LFTAGVLATQDYFSLPILIAVVTVAAIAGDSVGYAIGSYSGVHLFTRPDSILFKKRYVEETHSYFTKYGPYTVIIARFIPVVRTFAPVMAGVGKMKYSTFLIYNCIGGALWAAGITVAGFWLGNTIPNIDKYLLPVIGLIIIVSIIPPTVQWFRHKKPLTHDPQ
jgi:membrane-associated protein